jgi:hypothetical protein
MPISRYIARAVVRSAWACAGVAHSPVEAAAAAVAMGHERTHVERGGQRHGGIIVSRGRRHIRASSTRGDVAQEAERPRLTGVFTALTSQRQGALGGGARVLHPVGEQTCLAEPLDAERVVHPHPC